MLQLTIAGRLGRDAELRQTQSGPVLGFSVGIDVYRSGERETVWVDCSLWGKRAESLSFLVKGTAVTVAGSGDLVEYEKRDQTTATKLTLRADQVTIQSKRDDTAPPQRQAPPPRSASRPAPPAETATAEFDDDLPF